MHALITGVADLFDSGTNSLPFDCDQLRTTVVDKPTSNRRQAGKFRRNLRPARRRTKVVRRPLLHGRFSHDNSGVYLPGKGVNSAKLVAMTTMHETISGSSRSHSMGNMPWENEPFFTPSGKRLPTLSRRELAHLLGVATSELGRLGRHGVFHRLGVDRYQLDCRQSVALLNGQTGATPPRSRRWGKRPPLSASGPNWKGSGYNARAVTAGLTEFYKQHGGLLENGVNILSVPDLRYATLAAGMFLAGGLQHNERVAVVSFEHPQQMLSRLTEAGINLGDALQAEQLIYLYYKPDVAHSLSLSVNYRELFREIEQLGGGKVHRLVLFNMDALINANSEHLVHSSLHQLIYAANHVGVTLLGLFVASGHTGKLLDEGCRAILPGYFILN